jgi:zinc protease
VSRNSVYEAAFVESPALGLTVAGLPVPGAEFVQILLCVRAGAADEGPGEEGYAELLATVLCRGAGPWDRQEFALECDRHGASLQVFASRDLFMLELSLLPEDLRWGIELLGHIVCRPHLSEDTVAVAAQEQRDQTAVRADEQRTALADLARATLFAPDHAYGRPVSGQPGSLQSVTAQALADFHGRLLLGEAPLAFCLAGAFEKEPLLGMVGEILGPLAKGRLPHFRPVSTPGLFSEAPARFQQLAFPTSQNRLLIGLPALGRCQEGYLEAHLANEIFGGAFLSRLTRAVRQKEGLAYSAHSSLWSAFQGGCLWISLQTDNKNVPKALRTVRVAMEQLIREGLPVSEVEQFRQFAESSLTFEYDSLSGLASRLLDHVLFGEPWLPEDRRQALRRHSDREALQAILRQLLKPELAVVCLSGRAAPKGSENAFFGSPSASHRKSLSVPPLAPLFGPEVPGTSGVRAELVAEHPKGSLLVFPNGVHLLSLPRPELLSISLQVWTLTGSMDEPAGSSGMSHLLEHLMFRGTSKFPDGEFDAILAQKGGMNNAFTSEDFTVYTDYLVAEGLADALCLEADRFSHLEIGEDVFATEREVVLEERSLRVDSNPLGKVYEELQRAAFPNHPYGWPVIGWREDLQQLSASKLMAHYRKTIEPSKLLVVVAGGCDTPTASDWVGRTFAVEVNSGHEGNRSGPAWPVLAHSEPVPPLQGCTLSFEDRSGYSYMMAAFRFPREGHPDYEVAELLSRLLGQGDSSRLHDYFVRQKRLAMEVWTSYEPQSRDHPLFHLGLASTDDFTVEDRRADLAEFLRELPQSLTEQELEKVRRGWIAEEAFGTDELEDWALELAGRVMVLPWDKVWTVRERVQAVTLKQLVDAASRYLDPECAVYAHLRARSENR